MSNNLPPIPFDICWIRYINPDPIPGGDPVIDKIQKWVLYYIIGTLAPEELSAFSSGNIDEILAHRIIEINKDALQELYNCFIGDLPIESITGPFIDPKIVKSALNQLHTLSLMYLTSHKVCNDAECKFCEFNKKNC